MTTTIRYDEDDRYIWSFIEETFDGPTLLERRQVNDNGTELYQLYSNGVLTTRYDLDDQTVPGGVKPWEMIETHYNPDGTLAVRFITYDNGTNRVDEYENGMRVRTTMLDDPVGNGGDGAKSWSRIDSYYDQSGKIEGRATYYDNGIERFEEFNAGIRSYTVQIDMGYDTQGGAASWDRIETYYDMNGKIEGRHTLYDDGVERVEEFNAGVRTRTTEVDYDWTGGDGARAWERIETYYDPNGKVEARLMIYDDGVERVDEWFDGVRMLTTITDYDWTGGDGAKDYERIEIYYDDMGKIEARYTLYDNGVDRTELYANGVRTHTLEFDNPGGFNNAEELGKHRVLL